MDWNVRGRVWKFGDNVSGDDGVINFAIIRDYTREYDEKALAEMCMAAVRPEFPTMVRAGDLIVAGRNFALDNHPQVGVAIKACGVPAVIVESTNMGFIRKSLNVGLGVLTCPGISELVEDGDELEANFGTGDVRNLTGGRSLRTRPFSDLMVRILESGGCVPYLKDYVAAQRAGATTAREDIPVIRA